MILTNSSSFGFCVGDMGRTHGFDRLRGSSIFHHSSRDQVDVETEMTVAIETTVPEIRCLPEEKLIVTLRILTNLPLIQSMVGRNFLRGHLNLKFPMTNIPARLALSNLLSPISS